MGIDHVFDTGALRQPPEPRCIDGKKVAFAATESRVCNENPEVRERLGITYRRVVFDRILQSHWVSMTEPKVRIFPPPHTQAYGGDVRWFVLVDGFAPIPIQGEARAIDEPEAEAVAFRVACDIIEGTLDPSTFADGPITVDDRTVG